MPRTVVVTGASSGIGLATALHLAQLGFSTVGLVPDAAGAETLQSRASERCLAVEAAEVDLSDPAARCHAAERWRPWGLINIAGYMNAGRLQDVPLDEARQQIEVMVLGPMDLILQVLPAMVERGQGRIVNVTTSAVHTSTPLTGWYAATKAALRELNDALRAELRGAGVDVVDVEPGGYDTGIWDRAGSELADRRRRAGSHRDLYDRVLHGLDGSRAGMGDPEQVARAIGEAMTTGRPPAHVRVGPGAGWLRALDTLVPDRVWDAVVGRGASGDR